MKTNHNSSIRIQNINIENYKGIDKFSLEFPAPTLAGEPDVIVIGSENGLGKTSILECCALLLLAFSFKSPQSLMLLERDSTINIPNLLIKSGAKTAKISGSISHSDSLVNVKVEVNRSGRISLSSNNKESNNFADDYLLPDAKDRIHDLLKIISGFTLNPIIDRNFLFFHSYRKVQEGNPEFGMMVNETNSVRRRYISQRYDFPMSIFKIKILRSLMDKADLFEFAGNKKSDDTIEKLNELVRTYAGGEIYKLMPGVDNTVDFRINPIDGGQAYTFDGLSSGQKEIISTLFMIWDQTKNNPSVVLIDEPELHLNVQWQRSFIKKLIKLSPQNQYVFATHSEDIMDTIEAKYRFLLTKPEKKHA